MDGPTGQDLSLVHSAPSMGQEPCLVSSEQRSFLTLDLLHGFTMNVTTIDMAS